MLARRLGGITSTDYENLLEFKNSRKLRNRILGEFIRNRLEKLGKSQEWLAREIGRNKRTITRYVLGKHFPRKNILSGIYQVLGEPAREKDEVKRH